MVKILLKGFLVGWSVAWPPGPINAEMIRRGIARGFWPAWLVGLGACSGDFCWALAVSLGAGALIGAPTVRWTLSIVSIGLLLFLAFTFGRGAMRAWHERQNQTSSGPRRFDSHAGGYTLGFTVALTSPWNIAFWLAVIGAQTAQNVLGRWAAVLFASAVITGAAVWGLVLCASVRLGARFATPLWQVVTQAATSALMLVFAMRAASQLF